MQESRRDFAKKTALVVGATAVGATALAAANSEASYEANSNGVVVGNSPKKEVLYKKTKAWEDFYKQAL
ncbi:Tat pathway signal protein [Arcobacter sp. LA11]|uniref:Tat pathway signal protein n=1 Tax=Arcobacter sp. LA11 TaxID=1898176 RepID=UPI00093224C4|nr:Tat pathway signal protein [Arcobacter sp. LA11]